LNKIAIRALIRGMIPALLELTARSGNLNITVIMLNTDHDNLGSLLSDWLKSGRRSSPNTAESYRRNILDFMRFCAKAPTDVTVADVVSYQAHLRQNFKASSESQKLASIRSFFKFLKAGRVITENPAELIEGPRAEPKFKERSLTEDQVLAMIKTAQPSPRDTLFIRLLYVTAGRVSEVLALTWARFMPADDGGFGTGRTRRRRSLARSCKPRIPVWRGAICSTSSAVDCRASAMRSAGGRDHDLTFGPWRSDARRERGTRRAHAIPAGAETTI
jgi:integrase